MGTCPVPPCAALFPNCSQSPFPRLISELRAVKDLCIISRVYSCGHVWWYVRLVTTVEARLLDNDNETIMVILVLPVIVVITMAIQIAK